MQKSKLILTLKNIPQKELNNIGKYLQSKLTKDAKEITEQKKLFKFLIKYYPEFDDKKINNQFVYKLIYNQAFSNATFNRLNGRLLTNIKYYIQHLSSTKFNNVISSLNEAHLYLKNGDEKLFSQTISKLEKENNQEKPHQDYYLNAYLIENELLNFNYLYNSRKGKLNTVEASEKLDEFYIVKKLELTLSAVAQNRFAVSSDVTSVMQDYFLIKNYIEQKKLKHSILLKIYCQSIEMIQNNDSESYTKLKKLLAKNHQILTPNENKNFHTLIRNFCTSEYSKGNQKYLKESFQCYKNDLEKNFLYHNGGILKSTMQAIVRLGLRSGESQWVKDFLNNHKTKLIGTKEAESVFNYNMAEYYFYMCEYEKCLDNINETFEDIHYKASSKRLYIKALYETKSVLLESKINAFKIFLFRISDDKFTPIHKTGNNQFIDILKQIINPGTLSNKKRIASIESKIIKHKALADRQWLLDKLKEI